MKKKLVEKVYKNPRGLPGLKNFKEQECILFEEVQKQKLVFYEKSDDIYTLFFVHNGDSGNKQNFNDT